MRIPMSVRIISLFLLISHDVIQVFGQGLFPPQFFLQLLNGLPRDPLVCNFQCPFGLEAVPRAGHVPRYNGCGSYGIERLVLPEIRIFDECCNHHDVCYDTCGSSKVECDQVLQGCLLQRCNSILRTYNNNYRQPGRAPPHIVANCMSTAQLLGVGPVSQGCNPYMVAQMNACDCQNPNEVY